LKRGKISCKKFLRSLGITGPIPTITPHPFRPLTDDEAALLSRYLPPVEGRRGRRPTDRRRILDAIFWVACSKGPWKDLPEAYGRADTASRALRRWARSGHLDLLLSQVSTRTRRDTLWNALAWRIARAWRRISRMVGLASLLLAKRLGVLEALPAAPRHLPDLNLSKTAHRLSATAMENVHAQAPGTFEALARLMALAGGARWRWRLR